MPKIALSRSTVCLEIKLLSSVIHAMLETLEGIVCKSFSKFGSILEESVSRAKKCLKSTKMLLKRIFVLSIYIATIYHLTVLFSRC